LPTGDTHPASNHNSPFTSIPTWANDRPAIADNPTLDTNSSKWNSHDVQYTIILSIYKGILLFNCLQVLRSWKTKKWRNYRRCHWRRGHFYPNHHWSLPPI
jgi:hypothetical protein